MSIAAIRACAQKERLWPKAYGRHLLLAWTILKATFILSLVGWAEAGQKIGPAHLKVALVVSLVTAVFVLVLTVVGDWIGRVRLRYRTYRPAPRRRARRSSPQVAQAITRTAAAD